MIGDKITVKDTDGKYYEREILDMWTGGGEPGKFSIRIGIEPLPSGKSVVDDIDVVKN